VRRAEIFFDPQTHLANGVPLEALFGGLTAALADGASDHGISRRHTAAGCGQMRSRPPACTRA